MDNRGHIYNLDYYYDKILEMEAGSILWSDDEQRIYWMYKENSYGRGGRGQGFGGGFDPESEKYVDIINSLIK